MAGRCQIGHLNGNWKGGRRLDKQGYVLVHQPENSRSSADGYVREHILIAENALGKPLPEGVEVHHVNGMKDDNRPENLVICQDRAYHMLLEQRTRAIKDCGHANWIRCPFCKQYDDPNNLFIYPKKKTGGYHRKCHSEYNRRYRCKYLA